MKCFQWIFRFLVDIVTPDHRVVSHNLLCYILDRIFSQRENLFTVLAICFCFELKFFENVSCFSNKEVQGFKLLVMFLFFLTIENSISGGRREARKQTRTARTERRPDQIAGSLDLESEGGDRSPRLARLSLLSLVQLEAVM